MRVASVIAHDPTRPVVEHAEVLEKVVPVDVHAAAAAAAVYPDPKSTQRPLEELVLP